MDITNLSVGDGAIILSVAVQPPLKERLRALNLYSGAPVVLLKRSPFRKTFLLEANGVKVALGREVAQAIRVVKK